MSCKPSVVSVVGDVHSRRGDTQRRGALYAPRNWALQIPGFQHRNGGDTIRGVAREARFLKLEQHPEGTGLKPAPAAGWGPIATLASPEASRSQRSPSGIRIYFGSTILKWIHQILDANRKGLCVL